jgi:Peptidase_C39 like family
MKIQDFVGQDLRYDTSAIAADAELSQEIQMLLMDMGLLSEPIEDPFGDRAIAALTRFQQQNDCVEPEFLGPQTAEKLQEASQMGTRAPAPVITLEALETTALKLRPLASDALGDNEKWTFHAGEKLELTFFASERKHVKVVLSQPIQDSAVWYAFGDHVKIFGGEEPVLPEPTIDEKPPISEPPKPGLVKLSIPYKSQLDNNQEPTGTCNITCLAMCLEFLKVSRRSSSGQFEDELYEYALDHGLDRHAPQDLAKIVQDYGANDAFDYHATVKNVKSWLSAGNPAVTHGWFTRSGHIVALVGYDDTGFIVHDPNGEWSSSGYIRNDSSNNHERGKFQHYSYNLIERTCAADGEFWVHFISK